VSGAVDQFRTAARQLVGLCGAWPKKLVPPTPKPKPTPAPTDAPDPNEAFVRCYVHAYSGVHSLDRAIEDCAGLSAYPQPLACSMIVNYIDYEKLGFSREFTEQQSMDLCGI
jgi:hypothetical protein